MSSLSGAVSSETFAASVSSHDHAKRSMLSLTVIHVTRNIVLTSFTWRQYDTIYMNIRRRITSTAEKSNRKAMNRNWSNQKANPALKT